MKKYTTPLMVGLVSLGMVGGISSTLLSQNVFAAEETATTQTANTPSSEQEVKREAMKVLHDAARTALTAGDYATWSAKMTEINETRYAEMKAGITEENFAILQKIETARASGNEDYATVRELEQQLTVPMMGGMGKMHRGPGGRHMGQPSDVSSTDSQTQTDIAQ